MGARSRPPFPAATHREFFSYPAKVERIGRSLDGHLSGIFGLLLRIAIKDEGGLGDEAHRALVELGRARVALKLLRLAPMNIPKPFYDYYLGDLDVVVTSTPAGDLERPIEKDFESDY